RHVGPGDEGDLLALCGQVGAVGDKRTCPCESVTFLAHHLLNDRVSPIVVFHKLAVIDSPFTIVPLARHLCPAHADINLPQRFRLVFQLFSHCDDLCHQLAKHPFFACDCFFVRMEDLLLLWLEVLRVVPLGVCHCLLADVVLRDEM